MKPSPSHPLLNKQATLSPGSAAPNCWGKRVLALDYNEMDHGQVEMTKMKEGGCPQEAHSLEEIKTHMFLKAYVTRNIFMA